MQIGCDPKSDSTNNLRGGKLIPSVLDALRSGKRVEISDTVYEGFNGILCVEAGGPEPGVGCAGRGIITAIELLRQKNVFAEFKPDVISLMTFSGTLFVEDFQFLFVKVLQNRSTLLYNLISW